MNTYKIGVIRVLTTEDPELLNLHGRLLEQYYPMFQTVSRCIPDQWEGIHDDATMAAGVPKVVAMARQMYEEGFDAIIVSCAGDPGVAQARAEVPIPVIGGGESTATLARFYGGKVGTLGITADIPEAYPRILGDALIPEAGIGEGVRSTLDLMTPAGREATAYPCRRYSALELTDQDLVNLMVRDGQFVSLAHPVWSRMEPHEILALKGFHAIEVFNNGTEHLCHGGGAEFLWDLLLRHGRRVFATAVDDVHVPCDLFGGWVWVKARERSEAAILQALFDGAFYPSSGPVIRDLWLDGGTVGVACSPCREIHFVTYPPRGKSHFAPEGQCLTEATHTLTGRETYVRAVCVDREGRSAWSNPIFLDHP